MPVPRLRLGYIQGLYQVQEELRRAQDVVCTTDGEQLVICPPDSYRPLVSIPLTAITGSEVQSAEEAGVSELHGPDTPVLVVGLEQVEVEGAEAPLEGPLVFSGPFRGAGGGDVTRRVESFKSLLVPRDEEEMAALRAGDKRLSRIWALSIISGVVFVLFMLYAVTTCLDEPEEEQAPGRPALIVIAAPDLPGR
ncbi:MAG: hypothetical protein CL878_05330 [Dehalococcoidia bacterium]|nr:hypothetical protein [Dehalococcoidia bacterium]